MNAVFGVPIGIMGNDLIIGLFASKHWGEHDAVVVSARLGAKERDVVSVGTGVDKVLEHAARGHAGTNNDKFFLRHCWSSYSAATAR